MNRRVGEGKVGELDGGIESNTERLVGGGKRKGFKNLEGEWRKG